MTSESSNIFRNFLFKVPLLALLLVFTSCAHTKNLDCVDAAGKASCRVAKVCEGIYRGPRPADLNELKALNIRTILNLEDNIEAISREQALAKGLGIEEINIPMSGVSRPSPADLVKAVKIMEDPKFQPVYVHCLHGQDRTGLAVAAYKMIHDGWTLDRAYREAIDNGHKWWLYDVVLGWKHSLRELSIKKHPAHEPLQPSIPIPAAS